MRRIGVWVLALLGALVLLGGWAAWRGVYDGVALADDPGAAALPDAAQRERGAYLARAGNCMACHTQRGGAPYAGGRAINTPFGTVFSSNLTPDQANGIGAWSASSFWRAMHHGKSRDGRLLLPVFPYTSYTRVTREDSDALFAFLRTLPAIAQANRPHALRWPYDTQAALAVWRGLFFRPGVFQAEADQSTGWNRGAYLVQGLGHCNECHSRRNALGATDAAHPLAGGPIPMQSWLAPSLRSNEEAGVGDWSVADITALLGTGVSARGSASGPMAEVVFGSTQYLGQADLRAIAEFLRTLAGEPAAQFHLADAARASAKLLDAGAALYDKHCAVCHGAHGQGVAGAYPALAGSRAVQMADPVNLVQIVLRGGFAPVTQANPRPFGMPPYQLLLSDTELAAVLSYVRSAWGNQALPLSELSVAQLRSGLKP